jgi:hypothetical protein
MTGRRKLALAAVAALALLALPWQSARADVVIGVGVGRPYYRYHHRYYPRPRVYEAPPVVYVRPAPVVYVRPAPVVYVRPAPVVVTPAPAPVVVTQPPVVVQPGPYSPSTPIIPVP